MAGPSDLRRAARMMGRWSCLGGPMTNGQRRHHQHHHDQPVGRLRGSLVALLARCTFDRDGSLALVDDRAPTRQEGRLVRSASRLERAAGRALFLQQSRDEREARQTVVAFFEVRLPELDAGAAALPGEFVAMLGAAARLPVEMRADALAAIERARADYEDAQLDRAAGIER